MDRAEMESLVKQLKGAGLTEEQIMETFFETFQEGKMDRKDLEACAEFMGYELTDDFKNDATPDPIAAGGDAGAAGGVTEEQAEAAKEIKPGENPEEFKEEIGAEDNKTPEPEQPAPETQPESKPEQPAPEKEEETDEDKEWEEVQKKFKW